MLSQFAAGALLEASVGKTPLTISAPLRLALLTALPTRDDTGSTIQEVVYTGYSRVSIAGVAWGTAGASRLLNAVQIALPTCTGGSATVLAWALCTAATGGSVIHYGETPAFVIDTSDPSPVLPIGRLVLAFTNPTS